MADIYPESRVEEILIAMINGEEYTKFPESRIEALLIELLGKIIEIEGRGAYEFKGSVDFDELPETLTEDMAGWTYNMAEAFTTDSRFVDGSGKSYPQGTNVSVANVGTDEEPNMMFDVPSAFVDVTAIYNTIHTVVANLASTFSDQIAYHTGDLVVKDDILYKFTSDHAAGEWNPSHVSTATLASLLIEVYNTITQVSNTIPTQLSQLTDDSTHRLVTDTEKTAWNGKQSALTFDSAPTEDSLNPVTSDGIFDALSAKQDTLPLSFSGNDITTNGNLTADGNVLDGNGNVLAEVAALEQSASGNPIIVNAQPVDAKELSVELEPIQDLHGYSYPWAGGAYKNKIDFKAALDYWGASYTDNGDGSYTITRVGSGYSSPYQFATSPSVVSLSAASIVSLTTGGNWRIEIFDETDGWKAISSATLSQAGVNANKIRLNYSNHGDGATISKVQIELGSSVTSYAPYSNICPISGRTGSSATSVPKADYAPFFEGVKNGTHGFVDLGSLTWNYNSTDRFFYSDEMPEVVKRPSSASVTANMVCGKYYDVISQSAFNAATIGLAYFYTNSSATSSKLLVKNPSYTDAATFTTAMSGVYLIYELATPTTPSYTAAQWAALVNSFSGASATLSFGQTVYGGQVDFKTGEGIITHGITTIGDLTAVGRSTSYAHPFFFGSKAGAKIGGSIYSSSYKVIEPLSAPDFGDNAQNGDISKGPFNEQIFIRDDAFTDATAWQTARADQTICYELATPIELTLTPSMLELLKGYNYITADGDMQLVYIPESILDEAKAYTDAQMVKSATFTATTSASGNALIYNGTDRKIVGITTTKTDAMIIPFLGGGGTQWWAKVVGNDFSAITSTNISGTYYYI